MRRRNIRAIIEKLERVVGQRDTRTMLEIVEEHIREAIEAGQRDCWLVKRWLAGDRGADLMQWVIPCGSQFIVLSEDDRGLL